MLDHEQLQWVFVGTSRSYMSYNASVAMPYNVSEVPIHYRYNTPLEHPHPFVPVGKG